MAKNDLQKTTIHLFKEDVEKAKKAAKAEGLGWQTWLRLFVRRALSRKQELR